MICCHSCGSISASGRVASPTPALLKARCSAPKFFTAQSTASCPVSGLATSPKCATALPPDAVMSATTRSAASGLRSDTTTLTPLAASSFAAASPMPEPPPLTSATLPLKVYFMVDLLMVSPKLDSAEAAVGQRSQW